MFEIVFVLLVFLVFGMIAVQGMAMPPALAKYWREHRGGGKKKKRRVSAKSRPVRSSGKKKLTIPLVTFIQAALVVEAATGNRLDDMIFPLIDVAGGAITMSAFKAKAGTWLKDILTFIVNDPGGVLIDTAVAVAWTTALRYVLKKLGVPRVVNLGVCNLQVR